MNRSTIGANVAPPAFHQAWLGSKGNRTAIPFCVHACDGACVDNGPACLCHCGRRDPFVSVALATTGTQLAAIRASELDLDTVLHGLRDGILQLPACSPLVGDGSGSRCSCGVSFSAPAVSWGPPPIAGVYNLGARRR
jgi:hypothetical protein